MNLRNRKELIVSDRNFRQLLTRRQEEIESSVCVGLDPLVEKLPECMLSASTPTASAVFRWMQKIVDEVADYTSLFKPQHAHWEAIEGGVEALGALIAHIHNQHPRIPVLTDCKRGDIDRTQKQYAATHLLIEDADGMNLNQYMGRSTLAALIDSKRPGRALVGLGRTSNPEAWEIQDAKLADGRAVWELMVERFYGWTKELCVVTNAGIVMGAAHTDASRNPQIPEQVYSDHLKRCREIVGNDLWLLIPGIGTQGGFVEQTMRAAYRGSGSLAINSSSGIIFASSGEDFAPASRQKTLELRNFINQYR